LGELVARFLLGGAVVSTFAALGALFEPKRFGGLTAAAPSTALATLALAFAHHGASYAGIEARSMILGAIAFFVHAAATIAVVDREPIPIWLGAVAGWAVWFIAAAGLFVAATSMGLLR
jgi:hypothetical protein